MQNILFFILIVTFGLCSCTKDEVIEKPIFDAIGFRSFVGSSNSDTKASATTINDLKKINIGFKTSAYNTGVANWEARSNMQTLINNAHVTWNSGSSAWGYLPIAYWPSTENKVSFFAYSNAIDASYTDPTIIDNPKITFTVQDANANQVDLLASVTPNETNNTSNGKVSFAFKHILSRVGFSAKLTEQYVDATITVSSLKLIYAQDKITKNGVYTYPSNATDIGTWVESATPDFMQNTNMGDEVMGDEVILKNKAQFDTPLQLNADDKYLMLIPQAVDANDLSVEIVYTVSSDTGANNSTITNTVIVPLSTTVAWEPGKDYIYNLKISMHKVKFDNITIDDWAGDTNIEIEHNSIEIRKSDNLEMDAHSDFREIELNATAGTASIEVLDSSGEPYVPGQSFDAAWVKISPLSLIHHQVKQDGAAGDWQQSNKSTRTFVRPKYIPHKSVRAELQSKGIIGWNAIPAGKDDDDVMTFADATYRMCYKIIDINFTEVVGETKRVFSIYADEFLEDGNRIRTAKVKIKYGDETIIFDISQRGYISFYQDVNSGEGALDVLNIDGTLSGVKKKFVVEQFEEVDMMLHPSQSELVQKTQTMQFAFNLKNINKDKDRFRNGYYITAFSVYDEISRTGNISNPSPASLGFVNNNIQYWWGRDSGTEPTLGAEYKTYSEATTAPYHLPVLANNVFHPIYNTFATRYCHEKNRDLNGDGIIDNSENKWYMPSVNELMMQWIFKGEGNNTPTYAPEVGYWSATEYNSVNNTLINFSDGAVYNDVRFPPNYKTKDSHKYKVHRVRCFRRID